MRTAKDVRLVTRIHPAWQIQGGPVPAIDQSKPLIRMCSKCKRELATEPSIKPIGQPLQPGPNQSHGVCLECLRPWAEEWGIPEAKIREMEAKAN